MIKLLLLLPMVLLALTQIIAFIGLPGEADARQLPLGDYALSWGMYLVGFVGAASSLVLAVVANHSVDSGFFGWLSSTRGLSLISAVTVLAVVAGPLLWGRAAGEFHLSHHLVRAMLLVVVMVFYWWYVAINR